MSETTMLPNRVVWLTSFWGFDPSLWGGVGFTKASDRAQFLRKAPSGSLLAIYVTKHKGPEVMRGKLVGFLEITHETGKMKDFTSPSDWALGEKEAGKKGKWVYGVRASRAWEIVEEDWQNVETYFPETYFAHNRQLIGSKGVPVVEHEKSQIFELNVREVPVYGLADVSSEWIGSFGDALTPSGAVPPSKSPVLHKEADGPKRLYMLRLKGDAGAFLGKTADEVKDCEIIKVGFSVSPHNRCKQIQNSYPHRCAFRWEVIWQHPPVNNEPYPNAAIAIKGEDAMKKRLADERASLGGEFFIANESLVYRAQSIGKYTADLALSEAVR